MNPHTIIFPTDHLLTDLAGRSVRATALTLASQGVKFVLRIVELVLLARLLDPADFGLFAMATALIGIVGMFKDAGLSMATIQRQQVTHGQVSTMFWVNVVFSAALAGLVAVLAPSIVAFYGEPRLLGITWAIAASFIIAGLGVQHTALLNRQMRFADLAVVELVTSSLAIVIGISMACYGWGYWSLVGSFVCQPLLHVMLVYPLVGWVPGLPHRGIGVRSMLAFGGQLTGFNFVNYFSRNADNLLIGWYWGASHLGLYSRAYSLLTLPLQQINAPMALVAIPTLSRLLNNPDRYANYYLRAINTIMWFSAPLIGILTACAEDLVVVTFGPRWLDLVAVFKILAIAAVFQPVYNTIGWVFVSQGRSDRMLRWALTAAPLFVLSFLLGLPYGIQGVALGYVASFLAMLPWTLKYTFSGTNITLRTLAKSIAWPLVVALTGYSVVSGLQFCSGLSTSPYLDLIRDTSLFLFTCALFLCVPPVRRQIVNNFDLIRHLRLPPR